MVPFHSLLPGFTAEHRGAPRMVTAVGRGSIPSTAKASWPESGCSRGISLFVTLTELRFPVSVQWTSPFPWFL